MRLNLLYNYFNLLYGLGMPDDIALNSWECLAISYILSYKVLNNNPLINFTVKSVSMLGISSLWLFHAWIYKHMLGTKLKEQMELDNTSKLIS